MFRNGPQHVLIEIRFLCTTVESRFFEPPEEKEIGSNYREVRKMGGKITVFDW